MITLQVLVQHPQHITGGSHLLGLLFGLVCFRFLGLAQPGAQLHRDGIRLLKCVYELKCSTSFETSFETRINIMSRTQGRNGRYCTQTSSSELTSNTNALGRAWVASNKFQDAPAMKTFSNANSQTRFLVNFSSNTTVVSYVTWNTYILKNFAHTAKNDWSSLKFWNCVLLCVSNSLNIYSVWIPVMEIERFTCIKRPISSEKLYV